MEFVRTPDERFANLPGYPFAPHYAEADGLRIHYLDEGPADAAPVLLMHGEPSWGFLYRKMIPPLVKAGHRVVAPDLVGFGRSDKPVRREDYTYQRHVEWMSGLLAKLNLRNITLFCQDWGGLIGLRLVAEQSERFARVIAGNTGLPTGDGPISEAFLNWQKFSQQVPDFPVGMIIRGGCVTSLSEDIVAAYDAPFPEDRYKAGARQFPLLVPTSPNDPASAANRKAWESLAQFNKPFLTTFSDSDPITQGGDVLFHSTVPGAKNQPHTTIKGAGHFLQEDKGEEVAGVINAFIERTK